MIIHRPHASLRWSAQGPGLDVSVLRAEPQGTTTMFIRMAAGSHAPLHDHAGGEETYVISGRLRVGTHVLTAGDYLWTPPGVAHDGEAEEDTLFFVVLPRGFQLASQPEA
ncbi:MAG: cupin domain-containing protein [Nannocystaceae bacterium]|nr:cupin domain-containing protein [Nannocystaceae bacterium]